MVFEGLVLAPFWRRSSPPFRREPSPVDFSSSSVATEILLEAPLMERPVKLMADREAVLGDDEIIDDRFGDFIPSDARGPCCEAARRACLQSRKSPSDSAWR